MISVAYPSYRRLYDTGELGRRAGLAESRLTSCNLCPRRCGVDRTAGRTGFCQGGLAARVSSYGPHFGEESPLVGEHGSGTIFMAGCNLGCCFCQNYEISHLVEGRETSAEDLAGMMLALEQAGCHNINFVTPTHFVPQILRALAAAAGRGLSVPVVYNCGGYESVSTLEMLEGAVDIYMPDFKFAGAESAVRYCTAADYPQRAKEALSEMHRQVGDLVIKNGLARRGLLVRHLVMPGHTGDSAEVFKFLAEEISPRTFVNVMDQYRPCYEAGAFPEIARRSSADEFRRSLELARQAGLVRVYY
jgi:putative pyruvate formate lyase activating enzyme